ncbi:hypothetical protein BC833DRAFT_408032 [Globomyces pollinis-pini]|nr:hypothetical protein BC833DRAFT_408032 [Globomyces pollinis-pini]
MQLVIPFSTLRSKYIRTIPIGSVIKDPLNGHSYIIEEKKLNNALKATEITVEEKHLKLVNPKRANVNALMKNRISELEAKVQELNNQLGSRSKYEQIKNLMNGEEFFEDEKYLFTIGNGIVYAMKNTGDLGGTKEQLRDYVTSTWNDPQLLHSVMLAQQRLQTKLLNLLSKDSIEKVITFNH